MKVAALVLAAGALLAGSVPAITSANAEVVRKTFVERDGGFGRGCRTVRIVKQGFGGRRVVTVKRVCR